MMYQKTFKPLLAIAAMCLLFTGCKKWDEHNTLTDPLVGKDLFQKISENTNLSKFAELLTKSGYDKVIASSKTFTVFAPTNAALATLDPAIVGDSAKLALFVSNHIANLLYYTTTGTSVRIAMLSGKYNNMLGKTLEDANITGTDQYAKNGLLQIIDKMVPALPSIWDFLETSALVPAKQKAYMLSLFRNVYDISKGVQIGVDPVTGNPIYKAGTDSVRTNQFWRSVYDLRVESSQYTFFMLADAAWDGEVNKFKPYFITGTTDSTANLSSWGVVKDFAVEGIYTAAAMPDTILSKFNTKMGIEKSTIVQSIKTSNGIVHIMNKLEVTPKNKFKQYIIEGENYIGTSANRRSNTYFRERYNPVTGKDFRDVLVYRHGLALFFLVYKIDEVPALKYKAYWVALHDSINNLGNTFTQKLGIGNAYSTVFPYTTVTLNNYNEVYLGEVTIDKYNPSLLLFLTAANTTDEKLNPLVCDYIRLEPVL